MLKTYHTTGRIGKKTQRDRSQNTTSLILIATINNKDPQKSKITPYIEFYEKKISPANKKDQDSTQEVLNDA